MKRVILGGAAFLAVSAQANLIVDGGFEVPIANPNTFIQVTGGNMAGAWNVVGNDVLVIKNTYSEAPPIVFNSQEAVQALDITGAGNTGLSNGVWQDVATTVGQEYSLSFWVGRSQGQSGDNRYQTPAAVRLFVDSTLVNTYTNSNTVTVGTVGWEQFTYTFFAQNATTRVEFLNGVPTQGNPGWSNYAGLDDVQMEAVPEPFTMAGLAALALVARKRRKA